MKKKFLRYFLSLLFLFLVIQSNSQTIINAGSSIGGSLSTPFVKNSGTYLITGNDGVEIGNSSNTGKFEITGSADVDFKAANRMHIMGKSTVNGGGRAHFYVQNLPPPNPLFIYPYGTTTVGKYEKVEIGCYLPSWIQTYILNFVNDVAGTPSGNRLNPFDPDQVEVNYFFITPSLNSYKSTGFFYQEYERNENKSYPPQDEWKKNVWTRISQNYTWRCRIAPNEIGLWRLQKIEIKINGVLQNTISSGITFNCVPSSNKGFLKVGAHKNQLKFTETNESFFAIGNHLHMVSGSNHYATSGHMSSGRVWGNEYNTLKDWMTEVSDNGGNTVGLGITPFTNGFEFEKLGNYMYEDRLANAWELDKIFDHAHDKNLYFKFWILAHAVFGATDETGENTYWGTNCYNTQITGVDDPIDFFTNATAKKYFKMQLRYMSARWGYSTNTLWYELASEIDGMIEGYNDNLINDLEIDIYQGRFQIDGYLNLSAETHRLQVRNWMDEMSTYIKSLELNNPHLISGSYSTHSYKKPEERIFSLPNIDLTQAHHYADTRIDNWGKWSHNTASKGRFNISKIFKDGTILDHLPDYIRDKPFIFGEGGANEKSIGCVDACTDINFHKSIWATSFMNNFGAVLHWPWKLTMDNDLTLHYKALNNFMKTIDFEAEEFGFERWNNSGFDNYEAATIETYYMHNNDKTFAFGWVNNPTHYWGNYRNTNNCLAQYYSDLADNGGTQNFDDEHDNYNSPQPSGNGHVTLGDNIFGTGGGYGILKTYDVYKYSTSGTGALISTGTAQSNLFSVLDISTGNLDGNPNWDFAFKAYRRDPKTLSSIQTIENDTMPCFSDTLRFNLSVNDFPHKHIYYDYGNGFSGEGLQHQVYYTAGEYLVSIVLTDSLTLQKDTMEQIIVVLPCNQINQMTAIIEQGILSSSNVNITAIESKNLKNKDELNIKPNPSLGKFIIKSVNINKATLYVYDSKGAMVLNRNNISLDADYSLDLSYLNDGLYNVVLIEGNSYYTKKLIIQK